MAAFACAFPDPFHVGPSLCSLSLGLTPCVSLQTLLRALFRCSFLTDLFCRIYFVSSFTGFFREFFRRTFLVCSFTGASSAPFLAQDFTAFFVKPSAAHFFACVFPVAFSR